MYTAHKRLKDVATIRVLTAVKKHQNAFAVGAPPRTSYRGLQRSPDLIWEGERTGEGKGGKGLRRKSGGEEKGGEGSGGERKRMDGREGQTSPEQKFWLQP